MSVSGFMPTLGYTYIDADRAEYRYASFVPSCVSKKRASSASSHGSDCPIPSPLGLFGQIAGEMVLLLGDATNQNAQEFIFQHSSDSAQSSLEAMEGGPSAEEEASAAGLQSDAVDTGLVFVRDVLEMFAGPHVAALNSTNPGPASGTF